MYIAYATGNITFEQMINLYYYNDEVRFLYVYALSRFFIWWAQIFYACFLVPDLVNSQQTGN